MLNRLPAGKRHYDGEASAQTDIVTVLNRPPLQARDGCRRKQLIGIVDAAMKARDGLVAA
ncbi:MAG TPA: hypothetical protein VIM98_13280 [Dyella sp.]|uniref:hypothetical protein n=1 Tax=Dyella sp. TaxID=1869338 RepID=UPI002F94F3F8